MLCCLGYVVVSLSCVFLFLFRLVVFFHFLSRVLSCYVVSFVLCVDSCLMVVLPCLVPCLGRNFENQSPISHQVVSSFSISENFSVLENEDLSPRSPEAVLMGQVCVSYVGMTNTLDFLASLPAFHLVLLDTQTQRY